MGGGARQGFGVGAILGFFDKLPIAASVTHGSSAGRPAPSGSRGNAGERQRVGRAIALPGGGW